MEVFVLGALLGLLYLVLPLVNKEFQSRGVSIAVGIPLVLLSVPVGICCAVPFIMLLRKIVVTVPWLRWCCEYPYIFFVIRSCMLVTVPLLLILFFFFIYKYFSKRLTKYLLFMVLCVTLGLSSIFIFTPDYLANDGCPPRTHYSKGFSFWGFSKVRIGMTKSEVDKLIGEGFYYSYWEPRALMGFYREDGTIDTKHKDWIEFQNEYDIDDDNITYRMTYCYTTNSKYECEWRIWVFFKNGKVEDKYIEFWWD